MNVIDRTVTINAPRTTVWRYLEEPDLLAAWLMRNTFKAKAGARFQFEANPRGDGDGTVHCEVVEIDPPHKLTFTWNANDIGVDTLVTIELSESGSPGAERTALRLLHANFEGAVSDESMLIGRHAAGWADHLGVLRQQIHEAQAGGQPMDNPIDWSRFALHVAINAAPDEVLRYWATSGGMERFFVEMMQITAPSGAHRKPDEPASAGDRYVWRWHNGRPLRGEYRSSPDDDKVEFTFGDAIVTATAMPYRQGCLLRLEQSSMAVDEATRMHVHTNCRAAWVYFLTVLKTLIEHGVDARDRTRETGSSYSTLFDPSALLEGA